MCLLCYVRVPEWINTLKLPEFQGTPCTKQARYLNLSDSNGIQIHNHLVCKQALKQLAKLTNVLVLVNELSACKFESCCCQACSTLSGIHVEFSLQKHFDFSYLQKKPKKTKTLFSTVLFGTQINFWFKFFFWHKILSIFSGDVKLKGTGCLINFL